MKSVDFHIEAAEEANDAVDHYEHLRPGLGADFRVKLAEALTRIAHNPKLYAAERGTIRICPLDRFPYAIYYEELPDRIWVAAIAHHSRRPRYWRGRHPD